MEKTGSELTEKKALLEAALFLTDEPLDRKAIKDILDTKSDRVIDQLLNLFHEELKQNSRGIELIESKEKCRFQVKDKFLDKISYLAPYQEISDSVLQTLSIIAYNHPALQKDVVEVRGKCAYSHIKELIKRGLIKAEDEGRTKALKVTDEFLEYFGLDSPEEFKMHVTSSS
jgi:segregation and condensation protein B